MRRVGASTGSWAGDGHGLARLWMLVGLCQWCFHRFVEGRDSRKHVDAPMFSIFMLCSGCLSQAWAFSLCGHAIFGLLGRRNIHLGACAWWGWAPLSTV